MELLLNTATGLFNSTDRNFSNSSALLKANVTHHKSSSQLLNNSDELIMKQKIMSAAKQIFAKVHRDCDSPKWYIFVTTSVVIFFGGIALIMLARLLRSVLVSGDSTGDRRFYGNGSGRFCTNFVICKWYDTVKNFLEEFFVGDTVSGKIVVSFKFLYLNLKCSWFKSFFYLVAFESNIFVCGSFLNLFIANRWRSVACWALHRS